MVRKVVIAVGVALAFSGGSAQAADACSLAPTNGTVSKTIGSRSYLLNVPAGLTQASPLLLSLHGFGSNGQQDELFTGWTPFAAAHKFIVAYPQGRPSSGSGAWDPYSADSPDVGYLRDVASAISATYCVDPRRIPVDGWSNGGGTPTVSGFATPCAPSRPISVGLFAGQYDFTYAGLSQNTQEWRTVNGCAAAPTHTTDAYGSTDTYTCAGGADVVARVVNNTSHNWPSGAQGEDQRNRMWAFFQAHPLP